MDSLGRKSKFKLRRTLSDQNLNQADKKKLFRSSTERYSLKSFNVMDRKQRKIWIKTGNTLKVLLNRQRAAVKGISSDEAVVDIHHTGISTTGTITTATKWSEVKKSLKARAAKEGWKGRSLARMIVEQVHKSEIPEVVINIYSDIRRVSTNHDHLPTSCTICKVPKNLREVHRNAFDPKLVSIGPFHRDKPHLKAMEEHKLRFISRLIRNGVYEPSSTIKTTYGDLFEDLARAMKEMESKARECYSPTYGNISSNEFVRMMIIDGCFVVELLRLYAQMGHKDYVGDAIFTTRWMLPNLQRDLLLLENQLPFFVLEKIFELTSTNKDETSSLTNLTLKFFDPLLQRAKGTLEKCKFDEKPQHLLDLFHSSFLLSVKKRRSLSNTVMVQHVQERQYLIKCVTELSEAGAKFKSRSLENHDLLDVDFINGALEIPPLLVDVHTGPVFLNFIAYEQCDRYSEPYFTHYVLFMGSLMNSYKDVELLHEKRIINHVLGSDADVVDLFSNLSTELVHDLYNSYLSKPLWEVNDRYCTKCQKWKTKWISDNFSNPWVFSSFLAAVVLLLLTFVQTFFSIFSYVRPPS